MSDREFNQSCHAGFTYQFVFAPAIILESNWKIPPAIPDIFCALSLAGSKWFPPGRLFAAFLCSD
jgi:hypothetical protein